MSRAFLMKSLANPSKGCRVYKADLSKEQSGQPLSSWRQPLRPAVPRFHTHLSPSTGRSLTAVARAKFENTWCGVSEARSFRLRCAGGRPCLGLARERGRAAQLRSGPRRPTRPSALCSLGFPALHLGSWAQDTSLSRHLPSWWPPCRFLQETSSMPGWLTLPTTPRCPARPGGQEEEESLFIP